MKYRNVCLLRLSLLSSQKTDAMSFVYRIAGCCLHTRKSEFPLLPVGCMWKPQAFATMCLLQLTGSKVHVFILPLGTEELVLLHWVA